MKKILFILVICMFWQTHNLKAQLQPGECGIMFTYDATGSLIQREFICNNTGSVMYRSGSESYAKPDSFQVEPVSLQENNFIKVSALMPNPTTGKFTVNLAAGLNNGKVWLMDGNGKTIEKKTVSGYTFTFDISTQPSGVYFVKVEEQRKNVTFKVIKQ